MEKERLLKKENGITLIALVITIVVMLILAGVTINLTLGENGIFTTAQQAAKNYTDAQNKEMAAISGFTNVVDKTINSIDQGVYYVNDNVGNEIPVPLGFSPITTSDQGTKNTGFVIKNDTDGNEFVWIPVAGMSYSYNRYDFGKQSGNYSNYSETLPLDEKISINTYGGYYIGRYEAGVVNYDEERITTSNSSITPGELKENWTGFTEVSGKDLKLVVQADQQVWRYITRNKAKTISEGLYNKSENNVVSKLCSSYAWDTALKFMESTGSTYSTNSVGGYYEKVDPTTTGNDTAHPCNIYDMGGNVWEWTTESYDITDSPCVARGGGADNSTSGNPASYRSYLSKNSAGGSVAFRVALFM